MKFKMQFPRMKLGPVTQRVRVSIRHIASTYDVTVILNVYPIFEGRSFNPFIGKMFLFPL